MSAAQQELDDRLVTLAGKAVHALTWHEDEGCMDPSDCGATVRDEQIARAVLEVARTRAVADIDAVLSRFTHSWECSAHRPDDSTVADEDCDCWRSALRQDQDGTP